MDADVIVVGGGPAGSATATLLSSAGHQVLLLDRARFPRPKPCAEYLSPATADVLARLGALAAVEALRPARPRGMRLIQHDGPSASISYPDSPTPRRALCLSREALDATLLDHARARGVCVRESTQLTHVAVDSRAATLTVRDPSGSSTLTARLVIGADGSRSAVARSLGLARRIVWPRRLGLVAHFRQTERSAILREWGQMHVAPDLYCGLAPLPEGLLNVGMVLPAGAARRAGGSEAAFQHVLAALPTVRQLLDGAERVTPLRGVAPIAARVSRAHGHRFLLVGDAAGFLDPFTGEGVFRALRGAELAARIAHNALAEDDLSAHALQPYARLRRREFAAKTAVSWIVQVLLASPVVFGYTLRRLAARPHHASLLGTVLGDYHPAAAALRPSFLLGLLRP